MLGQDLDTGIYKDVEVMARDSLKFQFTGIFNLFLYTIAAAYADQSCRFCYAEACF